MDGNGCKSRVISNQARFGRFTGRLTEKYGFCRTDKPLGGAGHFECDVRHIKEL